MGCGASNSANAAVEPLDDTRSGAISKSTNLYSAPFPKTSNENAVNYNNTTLNGKAPQYSNGGGQMMNGTTSTTTTTTQTDNTPKQQIATRSSPDDPHWKKLWLTHKDLLLDPADVHATLQDLMANATNKLSDAELLFLQRKVRSIVRQSHLQKEIQINGNKKKKKKPEGILQELCNTSNIAKEKHLLTNHVLRKVLPEPPLAKIQANLEFLESNFPQQTNVESDNTVGGVTSVPVSQKVKTAVSKVKTTETTYLLALFCNDVLWDNVAEIAVDSAKANNLDMDVNHIVDNNSSKTTSSQNNNNSSDLPPLPEPCEPTSISRPERPLGMGMHALTFILGLALRK